MAFPVSEVVNRCSKKMNIDGQDEQDKESKK